MAALFIQSNRSLTGDNKRCLEKGELREALQLLNGKQRSEATLPRIRASFNPIGSLVGHFLSVEEDEAAEEEQEQE
eukprot:CAMPEP_0171509366 /NCGR_PEP_ID=MMETSP0958-20121227/14736_1 /TAXON_ID=87120 /ORGANISM="Aurantiochytrium limacinum, Strain ATCCMYA-1381" /LENGTH=75 /DNA_ID=CAMNT_0012046609 /DNA_START=116 /DNA_END=343 /DNA_ORIENTATION=+